MTDEDVQLLLKHTARDARTLGCPLCEFIIDVPPIPVSDQVGAAFGLSGQTLAMIHVEQQIKIVSRTMNDHLGKHKPLEWLNRISFHKAETKSYYDTVMELTGQPVFP